MQGLGRDLPAFKALGAVVLGISYDDAKTQHHFAIHCAANFPFLSDDGGKVAVLYQSNGGFLAFHFAKRRTFLIDGVGVVKKVYNGMPDDARILADLKALENPPVSEGQKTHEFRKDWP
jgi:peroxiredoxin Q/BCP